MTGRNLDLISGLRSYRQLLRTPGAARLGFSGLVARLPIAMRSISVLLLVSAVTRSLGSAGTVAGAMLIGQGAASPLLGRLADRFSQRRILLAACAAHGPAMTLLVTSIMLRGPLWLQIVAAATAGSSAVPFTSFMRARWTAMVGRTLLRTAYAFESMLDETIFLLGPLLVSVLVSAVYPAAGLIACVVLTTVGSIAVALHGRSEPAQDPARSPGRDRTSAIALPGIRVLMICYAGLGFLLGAVDVTMIAFAREHSAPGLGGVFLSLTAVGSLIAGTVYGAADWRLSQAQLLSITTCLLTLGAVPLAFAGSLVMMGFLAVFAGVAISPALIAGSTLLESLARKDSLSEAFSWLSSMGVLGIASGTAVGGQLASLGSSQWAAWAAAGGGTVALGLSVAGRPALLRERHAPRPAHEQASQMMAQE